MNILTASPSAYCLLEQETIQAKFLAGEVSLNLLIKIDQPGKWGTDLETLLNCLIAAKKDNLTLWNVKVYGELLDAHARPITSTEMFMTCYFNLGIDAEIGASKQYHLNQKY